MSGAGDTDADWRALARDWVTIWQSELAALADDREAAQTWQRMVDGWARMAEAMIAATPEPSPAHPSPAHRDERVPGPAAPAGATAAAAAPDARDAELERLATRVAELERRLAALGGG